MLLEEALLFDANQVLHLILILDLSQKCFENRNPVSFAHVRRKMLNMTCWGGHFLQCAHQLSCVNNAYYALSYGFIYENAWIHLDQVTIN